MNILWLKTELLHPVDKGGKIRTYNMLKELKRDHTVTYLTLDEGTTSDAVSAAAEYCHELIQIPHAVRNKFTPGFYSDLLLNLPSPLPYAIAKYKSSEMRNRINERLAKDDVDVLICDFLTPAVNLDFNFDCPAILFQHNVEAMIWKRHHQVQPNPVKKAYLYGQWAKMRSLEERLCRKFDAVVAVSAEDRDQMRGEYQLEAVFDVATGVDTNFFTPMHATKAEPMNLVFTGSMDWLPNDDAIDFFTDEILPLVKREVPNVSLTVVGRNPSTQLTERAKRDPSLVVTGRVEDVRPYMDKAAVYVVPLRIGGGTRLKIFEAMAMEKPIVSTSVGAEGLPLQNGVELLLADNAPAFADAIVKLLKEPELARRIGTRAAQLVRERFGWKQVATQFSQICEKTVDRRLKKADVVPSNHPLAYGER
ncbi:MAG TPA: glycosyltransferase [Pyrinomonadaceae bacterium]|nr:glycosyltransferase [Pyrinomonadaceae bacterium]